MRSHSQAFVDRSITRVKLYNYFSATKLPRESLNLIQARLLDTIVTQDTISACIESERTFSNILFPPEPANPRREFFKDILLTLDPLSKTRLNGDHLDKMQMFVQMNLETGREEDLGVWSGRPLVFAHLVRILACVYILSIHGRSFIQWQENLEKMAACRGMHPIICRWIRARKPPCIQDFVLE